jgi:hypothetical protein
MAASDIQKSIDIVIRNPQAWLDSAARLKRAADIIGNQFQSEAHSHMRSRLAAPSPPEADGNGFDLTPAYLMLAGYAVENAAKAAIVAADNTEQSLKWVSRNHLSVKMLRRAGLALVDGEPDLVERLSHRVMWAGRYPAPNLRDGLRFATSVEERGLWGDPTRASTNDVRLVDELFARMVALVPLANGDGTPGV